MSNNRVLLDAYLMIQRNSDQAEIVGNTYADLDDGLDSVAKVSGKAPRELTPVPVVIECDGLPPLYAFRIDYPGYLGAGGKKNEYYLATVKDAGAVVVALYRRQRGEVKITPESP